MTIPDDKPLPIVYGAMIDGTLSQEDKMKIAEPILAGAKHFFTCLENARLVDVRFGTVRVPRGADGDVELDLHDPASTHHARYYPGC